MRPRIIFITGTGTGVGKTLLTGLLLHHLRQGGSHALAMKPFCSGGTADVDFLHALQDGDLAPREINPFYFSEPIAPLIAARKHRRRISLREVLKRIQRIVARLNSSSAALESRRINRRASDFGSKNSEKYLLIEGSGGLLVPLGEGYNVADLIEKLGCEVIVAAANKLGTINHTLLTIQASQHIGLQRLKVVLMGVGRRDDSSSSNRRILVEMLAPIPVLGVPFLGAKPMEMAALKKSEKKMKKTLAQILG